MEQIKVVSFNPRCCKINRPVTKVKQAKPDALIEMDNTIVNKDTYYARNRAVVDVSNELVAFQVNNSAATQDTIDKAKQKGIPVKINSYTVE